MSQRRRYQIFEHADSNLAGFQWRVRYFLYGLRAGKVGLSKYRTGDGTRVLGQYRDGIYLWEDLVKSLEAEGYDQNWVDMPTIMSALGQLSPPHAVEFAQAPLLWPTRVREREDRIARLLLTSEEQVARVVEKWLSRFPAHLQPDIRAYLDGYRLEHDTLPFGLVEVSWRFRCDFDPLYRRLLEMDAAQASDAAA